MSPRDGSSFLGLIQNDRPVFCISAGDIEVEEEVWTWRGSLFTACKEIWVQGYPAADSSTVRPFSPLKQKKAAMLPVHTFLFFNTPTWAADFHRIVRKGSRHQHKSYVFIRRWKPLPFLSARLTAFCSLSSHWHQHKYYPNQKRKFFLNVDDKDIFENLW